MAALERMIGSSQGAVTVIKIGGGLTWVPQALDRVCRAVGQVSREWPIVVVPGGGPFADGVREFDRRVGVSSDVAHWMAILAMDQYAHVLASRIPGAVLVEEPGCIRQALGPAGAVVLAPSRWMRSADVLPHSWDVTSDSIAAFVAGALDARRLILIKPDSAASEPVDRYFSTALPAGLPYSIIGCDRIEELSQELTR
jgi:5-(aminomethyl)-3-furanmethanol phosphate kinase